MIKSFPVSYPCDLLERIIIDGAEEQTFTNVYRVAEYGINDSDAFMSSYLSRIRKTEYVNRDREIGIENGVYDIGDYSTSLFDDMKRAKKIMAMFEKRGEYPKILKGNITPEYGLNMYSKNTKTNRIFNSKHHIDWWIYEESDPSCNFIVI